MLLRRDHFRKNRFQSWEFCRQMALQMHFASSFAIKMRVSAFLVVFAKKNWAPPKCAKILLPIHSVLSVDISKMDSFFELTVLHIFN